LIINVSTAEIWFLALGGLVFVLVSLWLVSIFGTNRRVQQERLVAAHRAVIARPRPSPEVPAPPPVETEVPVETWVGEAYCLKCRTKRELVGSVGLSSRGSRMARGTCPICGTKVTRILPKAVTE